MSKQLYRCAGKEALTYTRAKKVAQQMRRKDRKQPVTHYRCDTCGQWHVGQTIVKQKDRTDA